MWVDMKEFDLVGFGKVKDNLAPAAFKVKHMGQWELSKRDGGSNIVFQKMGEPRLGDGK